MFPLFKDASETINSLTSQANDHVKKGRLSDAIQLYWNAYDLIPDPKEEYEASTWVVGAIGDTNSSPEILKLARIICLQPCIARMQ